MPQVRSDLPFIIGVLADLSGRAPRAPREPLDRRRFTTIDRDNFNDVMERLGPRVKFDVANALAGSAALPVDLTFKTLDDFAPDSIAARIPALNQLLAERRRLAHAPAAGMTDADLQAAVRRALSPHAPRPTHQQQSGGEPLGFLDQVLDHTGNADPAPAAAPAKLPAGASPVERIDALLTAQVNAILHHPDLRALEAAWRGLWHLVFTAETGPTLAVRALDLPRSELAAALADPTLPAGEQPALVKLIYSEAFERPDGIPFGLIAADYTFDPRSADLLGLLSLLAAAACVPVIAAAGAELFGATRWSDLDLATSPPPPAASPAWESLRSGDETRFLFLAAPRLLARYPYGAKYTAAETFTFEEDASPAEPAKQLWMNPAWALAALAARAFAESGRPGALLDTEPAATISGLPTLPLGEDPRRAHALETLLGRHADSALRDAGVVPLLLSPSGGGAALLAAAPSLHRADGKPSGLPEVLDACRRSHEGKG